MDTTLIKGMRVLEALANSPAPQSVTSLGKQLGLQKSNVHRTLAALVEAGYASKDDDLSRYSATLKTWEIGAQIIARNPLRKTSFPFLRRLHQETGETTYLAILDDIHVMYIDKIEAMFPLVQSIQPAQRIPAAFPASGLALLAHRPDCMEILRRMAVEGPPERPLDIDALMEKLVEVRARGYALTTNGWNVGSRSIAAVIMGSRSLPLGAIGIAGPIERLSDELVAGYSLLVRSAATQIAQM